MTDMTPALPEQTLDILIFLKPELAGWLKQRLAAHGLRSTIIETVEALRLAAAARPAMAVTSLAHIDTVRGAGNLPVVNFDVFLHMRDDGAGGRKRFFDSEQFFRRIDAITARRLSVPTIALPEPARPAARSALRLRRLAGLFTRFCGQRRERLAAIQRLHQARDRTAPGAG